MPNTTSYSCTPLLKKLGIMPGMKILAVNAPDNYAELLGPLPENTFIAESSKSTVDIIHWFITLESELKLRLSKLKPLIPKDGTIWISWPKKSAKKPTDLDENKIRDIILAAGLVDVKVCAIDETWSALKMVYRLKDR